MRDNVDIDEILQDEQLRPYFLDVVGKVVQRNLYSSYHHRFMLNLKAQKEFYDSVYLLTEKLKLKVPDELIQPTINEVTRYYMKSLKPLLGADQINSFCSHLWK